MSDLSTRRARKARRIIEADRCPKRPGIRHAWFVSGWHEPFDYTRGSDDIFPEFTCSKCGAA